MDLFKSGAARIINAYGPKVILWNLGVKGTIFISLTLLYTFTFAADYTSRMNKNAIDWTFKCLSTFSCFSLSLFLGLVLVPCLLSPACVNDNISMMMM
jgi:hypothetical protein